MKAKEIRAMNEQEYAPRLDELNKEFMKLKSQSSVSNPKSSGRMRQIKRTIARIMTIRNEKAKGGNTKE